MGMQCAITGKKPVGGNKNATAARPNTSAALAGRSPAPPNGSFSPNLQRVKVEIDGTVKTIRVAVSAIRSGMIKKPTKRKPFQLPDV